MASVELLINNKTYTLACDAGEEERVRGLGRMIDERARQLGPLPSDVQRFLMVALMMADELSEAQSTPKPVEPASEDDRDVLIAAVNHLAERIEHIAKKLAKA
jgi:cell division protein ZapA